MLYSSGSDGEFILLGAISPILGSVLGWIPITSAVDTLFLSAVGAATAWSVKHVLDHLRSKITAWWQKRQKK